VPLDPCQVRVSVESADLDFDLDLNLDPNLDAHPDSSLDLDIDLYCLDTDSEPYIGLEQRFSACHAVDPTEISSSDGGPHGPRRTGFNLSYSWLIENMSYEDCVPKRHSIGNTSEVFNSVRCSLYLQH